MDDNTPDTEAIAYVTARVTIHMGLTADGRDQVWTSIAGTTEDDDRPPLVTILGMLDMARTTAYDMYCSEDDEA